jgi:hypothetical protein
MHSVGRMQSYCMLKQLVRTTELSRIYYIFPFIKRRWVLVPIVANTLLESYSNGLESGIILPCIILSIHVIERCYK